jgi:hypothetical protein
MQKLFLTRRQAEKTYKPNSTPVVRSDASCHGCPFQPPALLYSNYPSIHPSKLHSQFTTHNSLLTNHSRLLSGVEPSFYLHHHIIASFNQQISFSDRWECTRGFQVIRPNPYPRLKAKFFPARHNNYLSLFCCDPMLQVQCHGLC